MSDNTRLPPPRDSEALGRWNNAWLRRITDAWGDWYKITCEYPRAWRAVPRDGAAALAADDPRDLRDKVIGDHLARHAPEPLIKDGRA